MTCPCPKHPLGCYGHPITCGCQEQKRSAVDALKEIQKIVHTPTKATRHKTAQDHFQADFDAIRKIAAAALPQDIRR